MLFTTMSSFWIVRAFFKKKRSDLLLTRADLNIPSALASKIELEMSPESTSDFLSCQHQPEAP